MAWNPLSKRCSLTTRPALSQGLASHLDDRGLEIAFSNLQSMEDCCRKLYKETKKYEESASHLQRLESKLASELCNSSVVHEEQKLRELSERMQSVSYQMSHATDDLGALCQKTVLEPMKKLNNEFAALANAIKKRDIALNECLRQQTKAEKAQNSKNVAAKTAEQTRKSALDSTQDFESQNRLLLLELPQFYEKRVDYFQPCLQALIRSQVDYYGECTRLLTHLTSACPALPKDDFDALVEANMADLQALSIVD